jgi:hypothetical protein
MTGYSTLKGCPNACGRGAASMGDPVGVDVTIVLLSAGRSDLRLLKDDAFSVRGLHLFIGWETLVMYLFIFLACCEAREDFLVPMQGANKKKLRDTHVQRSKITIVKIIRISHMKTV